MKTGIDLFKSSYVRKDRMKGSKNRVLQALITSPTIKAAADQAGVTEKTVYNYLHDAEFLREYQRIGEQCVHAVSGQLVQSMTKAVSVLLEIATDRECVPGARVQAARSILEYGQKFTELSDILPRIEALEAERRGFE